MLDRVMLEGITTLPTQTGGYRDLSARTSRAAATILYRNYKRWRWSSH